MAWAQTGGETCDRGAIAIPMAMAIVMVTHERMKDETQEDFCVLCLYGYTFPFLCLVLPFAPFPKGKGSGPVWQE